MSLWKKIEKLDRDTVAAMRFTDGQLKESEGQFQELNGLKQALVEERKQLKAVAKPRGGRQSLEERVVMLERLVAALCEELGLEMVETGSKEVATAEVNGRLQEIEAELDEVKDAAKVVRANIRLLKNPPKLSSEDRWTEAELY